MTPTICPACGHENESSRVFCQSCGMRLPQAAENVEQKAEINRAAEAKAAELRRQRYQLKTKKKFHLQDFLASFVAFTLRTGIIAVALAAIILCFRVPKDLPVEMQKNQEVVETTQTRLAGVADREGPAEIGLTEDLINTYLRTKVELRAKTSGLLGASVERTFVLLDPGEFQLGVAYQVAGRPMVIRTRFIPVPAGGGYSLESKGGYVGLLPLPSWIFRDYLRWYVSVAEVLERELSILATANIITIRPPEVTASWKPNALKTAPRSFSPSSLRSSDQDRPPSQNPLTH